MHSQVLPLPVSSPCLEGFTRILAFVVLAILSQTLTQAEPAAQPGGPATLDQSHFEPMGAQSPFLRTLGSLDSVVLTGVAKVDDKIVISVIDTKTRESRLVSETRNLKGWKLVEFQGDGADLPSVQAKIELDSGEVVSIRYRKLSNDILGAPKQSSSGSRGSSGGGNTRLSSDQYKEARYAAINYRKGFSSDGYPDEPPKEIIEKLSRMSMQERENINREMIELRNKGLDSRERLPIYVEKVNRASR